MTTIPLLKSQLKEKGLAVSGTKAELLERLALTANWEKHDSVYFLDRLTSPVTPSVACYDVDGTLITPNDSSKTWSEGIDDWHFREGMLEEVKANQLKGMTILLFTNQARKVNKHVTLARLEKVAIAIGEVVVFVATEKDEYRKPGKGMWQLMREMMEVEIDLSQSFYCGDASGLSGSFSDSDAKFAEAVGLPFRLPLGIEEEQTPKKLDIPLVSGQEMVILVGVQGSGKTWIATNHFSDYTHISKDLQGTSHLKLLKSAMAEGKSVVIDNTNPTVAGRAVYLELAKEKRMSVRIVEITTPLPLCKHRNEMRDKPVPSIAYAMYKKNYQAPTEEEAMVVRV